MYYRDKQQIQLGVDFGIDCRKRIVVSEYPIMGVLGYLPLSERNIRERLPGIPHYRVGKRLLFKKSELDHWMENHRENGEQLDLKRTAEEVLEKIRGDYPDD